jgi:WS/DGAT/MGAT family acyltransferase
MPQLSAHDATFLYSDTTQANANVTLVHIYNQSTAPGGRVRFKSILAHIASRLDRLPIFRQKLQRVPLDLDYPYWVDDENFDLEYHVRHIALPQPGDWRQFCIQASRIHARPLDLSRPLWEIYVIEGLDGLLELPQGSFALLAKTHHAAIDVESGSEITMLLHDLDPAAPPAPPPAPWFAAPAPRAVPMLARGVVHTAGAAARMAAPLGRALRRAAPVALTLAGDALLRPERMPSTRFNAAVSPHRVFETRRFTVDDFKTIRNAVAGATVNDAVLAVCGGALRRYLDLHGELPALSLTAIAPHYLRPAGRGARARPELSWMRVALGTDTAGPLQRLQAIHAQTASSEQLARAIGARELTEVGSHMPAATLALAAKWLGRASAGIGRHTPLAHCTITNVPGPKVPLYLCGARLSYFSAIMPIADGMGLVFAVTSHEGRLIISPTSCRELMPDPEVFAQCVRDSFQELLAAAQAKTEASRQRRAGTATQVVPLQLAAPRRGRRRASAGDRPRPTTPPA